MRAVIRNMRELCSIWAYVAAALAVLSLPFVEGAVERGNLPMLVAMVFGVSFYIAVLLAPDGFDA